MGIKNLAKKILSVTDRVIGTAEMVILIITGVVIIATLFYGAVVRYILKGSFPEQAEVAWFTYTWMVFMGSAAALRSGDHPLVSIIRGKRGKAYNVAMCVVCIAFLVLIVYAICTLNPIIWRQKTIILGIEYAYFYTAMIFGLVLMITRYVFKIILLLIE